MTKGKLVVPPKWEALFAAWTVERRAYAVYIAECRGDTRKGRVSPKAVKEAKAEWQATLTRMREHGGYADVRDMLDDIYGGSR